MKRFLKSRNIFVIAAGLAISGAIRMPVEQKLTADYRERRIAAPKVSVETWNQMGQTGLAGTFGGLRSVMASILSLEAQDHFSNQEWYELKQDYDVITSLDPYNSFYWSHGGWHLAYNAASWARNRHDLKPIQRETMEREYLEAGDAFYREGLRHIPDAYHLWGELGSLWSNRFKRPDYERALEAYKMAATSGKSRIYERRYVYLLAQIPGREIEGYFEVRKLLEQDPSHLRLPSFRAILYALWTNPSLPLSEGRPKILEIFRSEEEAYRNLYNYRLRTEEEEYFRGSIDDTLRILADKLDVPPDWIPFLVNSRYRIPKDFRSKRNVLPGSRSANPYFQGGK